MNAILKHACANEAKLWDELQVIEKALNSLPETRARDEAWRRWLAAFDRVNKLKRKVTVWV